MEDLGHLIATLLEAEATSACFCNMVHVSSHRATGKALPGQRIETLVGDRRWIPFLQTNGALVLALGLCIWPGLGVRSARPLQPQDGQQSGPWWRESQEPALSWARAALGGRLEQGDASREARPDAGQRRLQSARR